VVQYIGLYRFEGYYKPPWKVPTSRRLIVTRQCQKPSHSIYECKYHNVFCPKYRYRVLKDEVAAYTQEQICALCRPKEGVEVLELNIQPDHVHWVLSRPPKYTVSNIRGCLKGKLALRLFHRYAQLGKRFWGRHLDSRGYCVSTIGLDEDHIRQYVKWQEDRETYVEAIQQRLFDDEKRSTSAPARCIWPKATARGDRSLLFAPCPHRLPHRSSRPFILTYPPTLRSSLIYPLNAYPSAHLQII
jgi:putative transposase